MRILMLSQWFYPEPIFKGLPFAKELQRQGHEVEVLTGFPNYPEGKMYPGYRVRLWQRETIEGVPVIRVPLYPNHDASAIKRILNYASFSMAAACLGPLLVRRADVMYVYHPPATVALPAAVIGLVRRIPFVYDVQDLWPDTLAATGMVKSRRLLDLVGMWCRFAYQAASRIVVLSPGFAAALQQRGVRREKIDVIYNWCDETPSSGPGIHFFREKAFSGRFNIVFAGTMGKAQALDAVLAAAAQVQIKDPRIQFVFIGGGVEVERLVRRRDELGLRNVLFLPRRPMNEIGNVLAQADALLVHLRDDPLFSITIPSKTQAYLAAGKPVLMAVRGDAAQLVAEAGAGVCCEPEDVNGLAAAACGLSALPADELQAMGARGRQFYFEHLSLEKGVASLLGAFQRVVSMRKS